MHTFLLDLWHDLREKRLWPFAALLVIAIAAVPFTLVKKEEAVPPSSTPPAQTRADKLPTIALDEVAAKSPSKLSEFSQRNPFKSLADLPKAEPKDKGENQTVDLGESPVGDSSGSGSKGSKGSSGSGGKSGGSGGGSNPGGGSSSGPSTTYFTYRADVKFGLAGEVKAMKQIETFTLLGDEKEPAAMFMGVTDDNKWAVFAVDTARYESNGEHECKPSPERCEFVYLSVDDDFNETTLTLLDGSKSYDLEVTAIKRVVLSKEDVENVPTEDDNSDEPASKKRETVDPEPRSWFDIIAKRG